MAKMLQRAAPWSPSRRSDRAEPHVRTLEHEDTLELCEFAAEDPVANVFIAAHVLASGTAGPTASGAEILGAFDGDGRLTAACWLGANIVPVGMGEAAAPAFADVIRATDRRFASIFGPAGATLALYNGLPGRHAREVRAVQPLMALEGGPSLRPDPLVRITTLDDFHAVAPACVAMFEEEVGYSPVVGGSDNYYRRVRQLIQQGHSMARFGDDGQVLFKAELGAVSSAVTQVQGVWVNPSHRGMGLSHGGMAAVVAFARRLAPTVSLYVNDYNYRARACYERVGFERVGTFATVLF
ncbi:GNAT family N-acetyltransferase [Sinomonas sp. JGH33]|uniref:GNAT family N-acetyltransferase n=1 Tax=Sinomonas terricola TaxID=3110330 RepID=A0ABU5T4K9_9MICC|nr:GNAT family N-acetyltransferase [Sinomonas sp. JGH33]MEA5454599.1 GNAT family N-acetyltransferase [Sinomonas sp. JGH33]